MNFGAVILSVGLFWFFLATVQPELWSAQFWLGNLAAAAVAVGLSLLAANREKSRRPR